MRVLELITPAFLVIIATGFSVHIGSAQTPDRECAQLSNVLDDGTPLEAGLTSPASRKIFEVEAACRSALRTDPTNTTFMFQLGRALSLGNMLPEAIKYYLGAADRGHSGAMNNLGETFEHGRVSPKI